MDFWIALWTLLLWLSGAAFTVVTLYILWELIRAQARNRRDQ